MAQNRIFDTLKAQALEKLPFKIMWMDETGAIIYANTMFLNRLGYTLKELETLTVFNINPKTTAKSWQSHWDKVKKNGQHNFKAVHQTKQGTIYDVEVFAQFFSNNGKMFIAAVVNEISESSFYKNLLHHTGRIAHVGGWKLDLQDGSLVVTEQVLQIFETEQKEDLLPGNVIHLFEETDKLKQYLAGAMRKGTAYDVVLALNSKNGQQKHLRCVTEPTVHKGKVISIIGTYQDVTEERKNQTQLTAALEALSILKNKLEFENRSLKEEIKEGINYGNIICQSHAYQKVLENVNQVAPTDTTVLITGESGTGKELLAHAIHDNSKRKDKPLIKVNAATLPAELIESELFGHRKGAFTGATENKVGKFSLADGGTLFLDEIGELPLKLQPKLLRVIQEGEFDELGGTVTKKVNVRIVAATNRNLGFMVKEGKFREDLFYRLNVFPIHNIPLRERKDDIPLLAQYFLEKYSAKAGKSFKRLGKKTSALLMRYGFPGNIRELENLIERAVIIENGTTLQPGTWLYNLGVAEVKSDFKSFEAMQRDYIIKVLEKTNWRVSGPRGAATILQMKDKTLFAKMKRLGIEKEVRLRK